MMLTTRCWGVTMVLLCALLLQNCQSHSARATEEKEPVVSPSSASAMRLRTPSESLTVRYLTSLSTSPATRVSSSHLSTPLASEQALSTTLSSSALIPSASSALTTMNNSPKAPYNLPASAMQRVFYAVLLGDRLDHALSPDNPRVRVSKVEGVLREVPGDEEENSRPPFKQRSTNLAPGDNLVDKEHAEEGAEPDRAREGAKDVRLLALKMLGEVAGKHCVEKWRQSGDPLTILLDMASSKPGKAIQFLDVLLVAAQDNDCRQQALEALSRVPQASPGMLSECIPSLRAAAAKAGDRNIRLLALKTLGEVEWKYYFGEVESAPDLPSDMTAILDGTCPFWSGKRVKDTHLLVLIPAKVNGQPFSLNLLRELTQHPNNGGHKTKYSYYGRHVQAQLGAASPAASYWLLMTRDVLPGSRDKSYRDQKKLVAARLLHKRHESTWSSLGQSFLRS
jgi:hypothetical protein